MKIAVAVHPDDTEIVRFLRSKGAEVREFLFVRPEVANELAEWGADALVLSEYAVCEGIALEDFIALVASRAQCRVKLLLDSRHPGDPLIRRAVGVGVHEILNQGEFDLEQDLWPLVVGRREFADVAPLLGGREPEPVVPEGVPFFEAARRMEGAVQEKPPAPPSGPRVFYPRIFASCGPKGGSGKSTTAANVAVELSRLGLSVGLIDLDVRSPTQHVLFGVSEDEERGLTRLLRQGITPENLQANIVVRHGVSLLPVGFERGRLSSPDLTPEEVALLLDACQRTFGVTVADLMADLELAETIGVLRRMDAGFLHVLPGMAAVQGAARYLRRCEALRIPRDRFLVVLSQETKGAGVPRNKVAEILGRPVAAAVPRDERIVESECRGKPFALSLNGEESPWRRLALAALGPGFAAPGKPKRKGLFRLLFGRKAEA